MKKLKPILLLLLVFLAGVAIGVFGTRMAVRKMVTSAMRDPAVMREKIERDLAAGLDLSPEQRGQVREILVKTHGEIRELRAEFHPKFQAITQKSEAEIAAMLDDEQKAKFEEFLQKRRVWRSPPLPRPEQK